MKNRLPTSFRFKPSVTEKLERLRDYHQKSLFGDLRVSNTVVVEEMIERTYENYVREGKIKEQEYDT